MSWKDRWQRRRRSCKQARCSARSCTTPSRYPDAATGTPGAAVRLSHQQWMIGGGLFHRPGTERQHPRVLPGAAAVTQ